ncbi:MAG: acyl-CoA thioesterase [Acidobacteria bacterium]|nr:acyl-CoA thioesterase [Acidobacteriota bacterium]
MGVVYHSNYLIWMEVGRVELCRSLGVRYREMEREGVLLTVAEASCRYHAPAHYDDEVIIRTWIEQSHARMVTFGYEMREKEQGTKLATGFTKHVFCGRDLKPAKLPRGYWREFGIAQPDHDGRE